MSNERETKREIEDRRVAGEGRVLVAAAALMAL
jgi:hypothetical protein